MAKQKPEKPPIWDTDILKNYLESRDIDTANLYEVSKRTAAILLLCSGVCIPLQWVCDTAEDCADGLDEKGCKDPISRHQTCAAEETPCVDGKGCVLSSKLCDGKKDCSDGSDEAACGRPTHKPTQDCPHGYFLCDDGTLCVSQAMVCNGHQDCYDGTDEVNCTNDSTSQLAMVCNGHQDCYDGTDEVNCTSDSTSQLVNTYYKAMVCNGHQDCYDGTDEVNCTSDSTSQLVNTYYKVSQILQSEYTLFIVDGTLCVSQAMVCNGHQDCYDGTDEVNCTSDSTSQLVNTYYKVSQILQSEYTLFIVDGTLCVSQAMVCNGHQDCYDGTDEVNCTSDSTSQLVNTYYKAMVCNGHQDCYDGTDELNCTSDSTSQLVNTYYKASHLLQSVSPITK
ncbi:low-density lipoprotein receptor domain class A domain-containing protein [Phthorimaea operculella]|nr:low-density lipoprotein receptor domain class A domain-containing protein [Phthorimaea operculella]